MNYVYICITMCMSVYVCICIYIWTYVYVCMNVYMYVHVRTYKCLCIHVCEHMNVRVCCMYMYVHIWTYKYMVMYACVCTCMYIYEHGAKHYPPGRHREASLGNRGSFSLHSRDPFNPLYFWLKLIKWRILDMDYNAFYYLSNIIHCVFATLLDLLKHLHDFVNIVGISRNRCSQNWFKSIQAMSRSHYEVFKAILDAHGWFLLIFKNK